MTQENNKEGKKKLIYEDLKLPTYVNTRPVMLNLDASDMAIAAVLGGLNLMLVGETGTGKSQLATDIYRHYFGGNKSDKGNGLMMRGRPDLDVYNEIFTQINLDKAKRELTSNIDSIIYFVDELNRCPPIAQNQFFGMGDKAMDYEGKQIQLGKDGYGVLIATANIGNGEFSGTFNTDKALYNRLHVALDFDNPTLSPTERDEIRIDILKSIDPNLKFCNSKDISNLILGANKDIQKITQDPGLEALAAMNYLRFGLRNCRLEGEKPKYWPEHCQTCANNKNEKSLCSLIKDPKRRTTNSLMQYSAALHYLAKLKDPRVEIDPIELVFGAFKITGAYQSLLNPQMLSQQFYNSNPKMMDEVVDKLKEDFRKNEDFIMTSLQGLQEGEKIDSFYKNKKGEFFIPSTLNEEAKKKLEKIEPYTNQCEVGLGWMNTFIDEHFNFRKSQKEQK